MPKIEATRVGNATTLRLAHSLSAKKGWEYRGLWLDAGEIPPTPSPTGFEDKIVATAYNKLSAYPPRFQLLNVTSLTPSP